MAAATGQEEARRGSHAEGPSSSALKGEPGAAAAAAAGRARPAGLMPELPLCSSVAGAAAAAALPARVRIIPDDVQDALDLLRAGAARRAHARGSSAHGGIPQ